MATALQCLLVADSCLREENTIRSYDSDSLHAELTSPLASARYSVSGSAAASLIRFFRMYIYGCASLSLHRVHAVHA
jgi:hypothetical protein